MRRVRYYEYGDPEVLKLEEVDVPEPGPGQVLLRTEGIGANFVDTKFRRGAGGIFQRELPGTVTGDLVGTVERVGPDVDGVQLGARVGALAEDAFADYVLADAAWLAPVPDGVDLGLATMLPMGGAIALRTLKLGHLVEGETVLVHAAAGGIGHLAVQLAKLLGTGTVIATASSPAKLAFAREHGADVGVDYSQPDWADQVRAAAPNGVDVILDSIGGDVFDQGIDLLAPLGRQVVYGQASGEATTFDVLRLVSLKYVTGYSLLAWRAARPELARQDLTDVAAYAASGQLRTSVHATLPLTDAAKAHRILENREQLGRVVVVP